MNNASRGFSLRVLIALAIMLSTLVLGGVLAYKSYLGMQQALVSASADTAQQLSRTINERARRLLDPALSSIQLLAYDPLSKASNLPQRLDRLPLLVASLNANKMLSAVYAGYPNGEFLLVRVLRDDSVKQRLHAPPEATYLVQSISLDNNGQLLGEWRFYDGQLSLLKHEAKADYHFDPRTRPWFIAGMNSTSTALTKPYVFFTTREIGLTLSQRSIDGAAVLGMDASVNDLGSGIDDLSISPGTEIAVVDSSGTVLTYPDLQRVLVQEGEALRLSRLDELGVDSLNQLFSDNQQNTGPRRYQSGGQAWYGMRVPLSTFAQHDIHLLIAVPAAELLMGARQALAEQVLWAAALILLLLVVGWVLAQRIARPLQILTQQVGALSNFDFGRKVGVKSQIIEVRELSQVLGSMARTINNFQAITFTLSRETQLDNMLGEVLDQLVEASTTRSGAVYLLANNADTLQLAAHSRDTEYPGELQLTHDNQTDLDSAVTQALGDHAQYLTVALNDRSEQLLGILVLQLGPAQLQTGTTQQPFRRFVQELSGAAAVAIETRQLIEAQQRLLDAIIKLLADATDAKSPYTGGHCQRVPQLAEMLIDKVIAAPSGPYAQYQMSAMERYEFKIAAWLHDCGKVTSPEYVVDKATKLETLYNRIHEIRTRFEVLWRDAELEYWKGVAAAGDQPALQQALHNRHAELQDEFSFIANANIGGEFMSDADIERLQQIGTRRWLRHFDNRLGLSRDEAQRLAAVPIPALPAEERLLADRDDHLVPWGERKPPVVKDDPRNVWGFDMRLPAQAYNYGELYNLSIRRGTLTEEERFKINEHIVQTIIMLNTLPLPRHLKRVPNIAGNHHEKMDGTGYPRRLRKSDMSIAERVIAIADIFEALSAADRPYKPSKTLSESLTILSHMARDQHIDAELFRLFLTSGVYREYGEKFLHPEQLDEVDIQRYLAALDEV
ncbi:HD domain-containing phosphohydrolase [Pseudomonas sp. H9]|uniref:HD domain-containing phosphohydrolase n=1 Tax=Pseudomonas sp. H9 TaxID=483968 RepID=UPI001057844C|nr:HD domain-containing phosphohydrolase [Pseudomonas sp. H9]TDF81047.1 HD domain-containing protein [Pseudomonas sp. H9]